MLWAMGRLNASSVETSLAYLEHLQRFVMIVLRLTILSVSSEPLYNACLANDCLLKEQEITPHSLISLFLISK